MGNTKNSHLKVMGLILLIVFLITGALLLLEVWDRNRGRFQASSIGDGVLKYEGVEYVLKDDVETFLVLGLDKYDGAISSDSHDSGVQSDFLMLFVYLLL